MPRQKTRTNTTLACIYCQRRHEKCESLPGEDICTNCREHNRLCVFIPGNKRGPKPRRQNIRLANLQAFSNINPYSATQTQHWEQLTPGIENSSHPVSRASYTQSQHTHGIECYSFPTTEVHIKYQSTPSTESYSRLTPGVYNQYQEPLTQSSLGSLYPVLETTEVFQNMFINQSSSTSFLPSFFTHEEPTLNIDASTIIDSSTIIDHLTINDLSTLNDPQK
ncbi:7734_t:CDS:1 [Cetraspora pellucida]|uniref:7734_t:CDS:1 n=1 Tax=Cetraspora pellucida TaxID=1433469 RepID=A0ACA9N9D9_9GLOM|nr:7734_t:CDS:1 [Cetraspora pellucida]